MKRKLNVLFIGGFLSALSLLTACGSENVAVDTPKSAYESLITLGNYKDIETGVILSDVTDEDIQAVIDETVELAGGCYTLSNDEAVAMGYKVAVEEIPADGDLGFSSNEYEMDENSTSEEYINALLGKKVGDVVEANGNTITITGIYIPADIDDEFVSRLGIEDVSTVEELKEDVKAYLENKNLSAYNEELKDTASELVVDASSVEEIPQELIDKYVSIIEAKVEVLIEQYKTDSEEEVTKADILAEQIKEDEFVGTADEYIEWYAQKSAKEYMVYSVIAAKENISVTDEEVYSSMASDWVNVLTEYETLSDYIEAKGKEQYEMALLSSKVVDFIAENTVEGILASNKDDGAEEAETAEAVPESSENVES